MTTNSARRIRSKTTAGRRLAAWPLVAVLAGAGAAGCSSSDSGAMDEYLGTWTVDEVTSNLRLSCPFLAETLDFPLWKVVRLEEGTLSDLVDLGGPCPGYYEVSKDHVATLASPDPFTGAAPICRIDQSGADEDPWSFFLELQFGTWNINFLQPVKGQAPKAQMIGNANVPIFSVDAEGTPQPDPRGDCTYVVKANLTQIGRS